MNSPQADGVKLRAVVYTRVSSMQQIEGTSLETQYIRCIEKARQVGAEVVAHYEDAGVSGAKYQDRPGIQAAIRDIEAARAELLICYDLSRYSHDSEHQVVIKRRIESAGGRLLFCTQNFEAGADGDLMFDITRAFPVWERRKFRERSMLGKARQVEQGIQPFRTRRPYGYRIIGRNDVVAGACTADMIGKYVIVEEEAAIVRELFTRYVNGETLRKLCRWLNEASIPTPQGGQRWRVRTLSAILHNTIYMGMATSYKTEKVNGQQRPTPPERWKTIEAPALVSEQIWNLVQDRMKTNANTLRGNPNKRYALSGLTLCPRCGCRMKGHTKNAGRTPYFVCPYNSPQANESGRHCNSRNWRADILESAIQTVLSYLASHPEAIAVAVGAHTRNNDGPDGGRQEKERIEKELTELKARESAVAKAQVAGIVAGADPAVYHAMFTEIADKKKQLHTRLAAIAEDVSKQPAIDPAAVAASLTSLATRITELLTAQELNSSEKNTLLVPVIHSIMPEDTAEGVSCRVRFQPAALAFAEGGAEDVRVNVPLKDVKGIGPKKLEKMRPFLSVR